ncbi:MAG: 2,3-bisphosphoglycerate-independent phosphoglycerate mutase [Candidatus Omnitrophica bacterium]|nr:2,3-bisphosphoglycerate-independent phosphoglycerate mutase [Candidatus Omnitrophota bacterium]
MSLKLEKLKKFKGRPGPLLFIIMDGVGIGKQDETDGVFSAKTPCLDQLFKSDLFTTLQAHGTAVGLPTDDDMGNSEVGHNALGAGRVFEQGAKLVDASIETGEIFKTPIWEKLTKNPSEDKSTIHLVGLLSDGNVHSHIKHFFALIKQCAKQNVKKLRLHILLDGRDVGEKTALGYVQKTEELLRTINDEFGFDYCIASGGGRMITTMDRYAADWSVVKRGWDAHVLGKARMFESATQAIQTYYDEDPKITDQYLESFVVAKDGNPVGKINDGDSVVFLNFRGDRAIELSRAFDEKDFSEFDREYYPNVIFAGMMEYDGDLKVPKNYLVNPPKIDRTIGEYLCDEGIKSFALSETQKYGHVTYFWNGNKSGYINEQMEKYIEIPSDKVRFEQAPKMKVYEITEKAIELLKSGEYKFGRINFPNGDMVGHTGVVDAIKVSMEALDECVCKLIKTVSSLGGITVVSADHGNADEMFTEKNGKHSVKTAHTLNPVPFIIVDSAYDGEYKMADLDKRGLSNVAATLLNFLGFNAPKDYDSSLISVE